jgi:multicomponent Na+:H+ antiporter subunit E
MSNTGFRRTSIVQFVVLLGFWFALSRRASPLFVVIGVVSAATITIVTRPITSASLSPDGERLPLSRLPGAIVRGVLFSWWMAGRILVASVQLAVIALSPKMPLDPCTVRFRTQLRRPLARTTLANAISLVPGTLTVDIVGDELVVHALSPTQVDDLVSGRLQNKVAALFLEEPQPGIDPSELASGGHP